MDATRRSERGASLIIVLVVCMFLGLVVPVLLSLVTAGSGLASASVTERRSLYTATSGIDAAIQNGRAAPWVGRFGFCPTEHVALGDRTAVVTCSSVTALTDLDRTVSYAAAVDGAVRVRATVIYRDSAVAPGVEPPVDVISWIATNDPIVPTATIALVGPGTTNSSSVSWTVVFSEPVTGVSTSNFSLASAGLTGASITGLTGSGRTYTLTASTGSGNGTLGLDLSSGQSRITNAAGDPISDETVIGPTFTIDKTAPTVVITRAGASPTNGASVMW